MTRAKRRVLLAALLPVALLVYCVATVIEGYVRASRIVARHMAERPVTLWPRQLSAEQLQILLAVEDPSFMTHRGFDLRTPGAGMTTITQGLVKLLYFDKFKPGLAKIRQTLLAIGFDARIEKSMQLALFLNSAYLGTHRGREVLGFEDAARTYFGKPFADLDRREYLSLVAMCIGPNQFSVAAKPDQNARRVARIERLLAGQCRPTGLRDVYYESCE